MKQRYLIPIGCALLCSLFLHATPAQAQGTIVGRVTEVESGAPLPGANVLVEGTTIGVSTDRNGRFTLRNVSAGPQTLVASFVGYEAAEATVDVQAGASVEQDFELTSQVLQSGEIVVTGLREGQVRAINQKKQALQMMDVLSADAIGKLPDQNVAEAVQRISGVSIQTDRGEGRFVRIRGTSAELNNVTLNGQTLASTAPTRATALDLLPSDMISSIEVVKAVTPDMDANAVGGTLNINTLTAFDRSGPFLFGSLEGVQHQQVVDYGDDKLPYRASVTAGTQFGADKQFGLVLSGSASRRDFKASILDPDGWEPINNSFVPDELEAQVEDNERERYGGNLNFDYRPTETTALYARALVTHTQEIRLNSEFEFGFVGDIVEGTQTATTGRFPEGSAELDLAYSDDDETLYSFELGGEQRFGAVTWEVNSTYTRGIFNYAGPDATTETDEADAGMLSASYDTGPYFFVIDPDNPSFVQDPANYPIREVDVQSQTNEENTYIASTDLRWDTNLGPAPGFVQVGGKVQIRDKVVDRTERQYLPLEGAPTLASFTAPTVNTSQPNSPTFVHGDVRAFRDFVNGNIDDESLFELDVEETTEEAVEADSDNEETIYAGYGMGSFTIGSLNILAGLRVEHTVPEVTRFQLVDDGDLSEDDITSETFTNSYTDVLPSIHLRYAPTNDFILRAAWSNTIGRPDYDLLAAFEEVSADGTTEIGIERGNPDLLPFRSMGFDAFAEYYLPRGGLLSIGGFYKRIDNPIYSDEERFTDFTFEGVTYDEAEIEQTVNADAGTLLGAEATFDALLTFLPAPFDGFGFSSNVAIIDSEVTVPGRDDELPFFGQSDFVLNLAPYFQKWGLETRVAWSYQSPALIELEGPGNDRYDDRRSTVDVSASYALSSLFRSGNLTLFGKVRNITNEAETRYQGSNTRYDRHVVYGRTFTLGVTTSF